MPIALLLKDLAALFKPQFDQAKDTEEFFRLSVWQAWVVWGSGWVTRTPHTGWVDGDFLVKQMVPTVHSGLSEGGGVQ